MQENMERMDALDISLAIYGDYPDDLPLYARLGQFLSVLRISRLGVRAAPVTLYPYSDFLSCGSINQYPYSGKDRKNDVNPRFRIYIPGCEPVNSFENANGQCP